MTSWQTNIGMNIEGKLFVKGVNILDSIDIRNTQLIAVDDESETFPPNLHFKI